MKKFIALFVALVLCLGMLSVASAEATEAEVSVVDWAEIEPAITEAGIEGEFYALEDIGLMFWVPNVLLPVEAPDDGNIYLAAFMTEDETAAFMISMTEPNEALDFDTLLAALEEAEGIEGLGVVVVNGLASVAYTVVNEDGTSGNVVSIVADDGSVLSFAFNAGDEGYETVSAFICASIQVME